MDLGLKITEILSLEPPRIGPKGSSAHPGILGKYVAEYVLGIIISTNRNLFKENTNMGSKFIKKTLDTFTNNLINL